MEEITLEKIVLINSLCLKPGERNNILSNDRLFSALSNQYQPYDSDMKRIASMYKALILDHAFENGNKRTAVIVMCYLAESIGINVKIDDVDLCDLTYRIADAGGSQIEVDDISNLLFDNLHQIEKNVPLNEYCVSFCDNHRWLIDKLGE